MNKAIFLDRDGTINFEKNYTYRIEDFEFTHGAIESLRLLQDAGYMLVIISNQSGVARGYYTEADVVKLHDWLRQKLASDGVTVSGIYYCPHHSDGIVEPYNIDCDCRKPKLEMFCRVVAELDIDLDNSFAVGDRMRDLRICEVSGCRGYLVGDTTRQINLPPNITAVSDLKAATEAILHCHCTDF
jgi:D-glycero-D-manno-heptose 1,7-bisphosphate phosphatase